MYVKATPQRRKRQAEAMTIEQLKRGERVGVDVIPFFIFLFRDGLSFFLNCRSSCL